MEFLADYSVDPEDLQALANLQPRSGFSKLDQSDFLAMLDFMRHQVVISDMVPILSNNNGDYWCLYTQGILRSMVCFLSHDEFSLEPNFKNIGNLVAAISRNTDVGDYFDLSVDSFDFPKRDSAPDLDRRLEIIDALQVKLRLTPIDEELTRQTAAFSIMVLAAPDEVETLIVPFLDDEDMYVQERAIRMVNFHDYVPARARLQELRRTGMQNGRLAAGRVLEKWRSR